MRRSLAVVTALLASVTPRVGYGDDDCGRLWRFQLENDTNALTFGYFGASDQNYTGGWRLSYATCRVPRRETGAGGQRTRVVGGSVGLKFYSPELITAFEEQEEDRPFAAAFSGELFVRSERISRPIRTVTATLIGGFVGDGAGGEAFQSFIHRFVTVNTDQPHGWPNQIGRGIELNAAVRLDQQLFPWPEEGQEDYQRVDLVAHTDWVYGTTWERAAVGARLRFGFCEAHGWVPPSSDSGAMSYTAPGVEATGGEGAGETRYGDGGGGGGSPETTRRPDPCDSKRPYICNNWHVFLSGEGRLVGYNGYLEGVRWLELEDSPVTQQPRMLVGEIGGGLVFNFQWWSLTYGVYWRSREMVGAAKERAPHRFAEIQLAHRF